MDGSWDGRGWGHLVVGPVSVIPGHALQSHEVIWGVNFGIPERMGVFVWSDFLTLQPL